MVVLFAVLRDTKQAFDGLNKISYWDWNCFSGNFENNVDVMWMALCRDGAIESTRKMTSSF